MNGIKGQISVKWNDPGKLPHDPRVVDQILAFSNKGGKLGQGR